VTVFVKLSETKFLNMPVIAFLAQHRNIRIVTTNELLRVQHFIKTFVTLVSQHSECAKHLEKFLYILTLCLDGAFQQCSEIKMLCI